MVKAHKISNWAFIALIVLTLVVFGMFYLVGYDNMQGEYNAPENTDLLLGFMYAMAGLCIVAVVAGAIMNAIGSIGAPKGVNITGVPTKAISLVSLGILVATLVISWIMASDAPVMTGEGAYTDTFWLKVTDLFIFTLVIQMACAGIGLLVNLTGIFRK